MKKTPTLLDVRRPIWFWETRRDIPQNFRLFIVEFDFFNSGDELHRLVDNVTTENVAISARITTISSSETPPITNTTACCTVSNVSKFSSILKRNSDVKLYKTNARRVHSFRKSTNAFHVSNFRPKRDKNSPSLSGFVAALSDFETCRSFCRLSDGLCCPGPWRMSTTSSATVS